ncbi:bifunctional helix-turn-helix transcriptional regulator/GNAT family N-acetyltransferase [Dyella sp. A6]|uniref:bifunctional helix-turn-helix transcriptional regulator/GNAT family N-acetyltransferase n=1 Tax=Dyella aluminiiresistens TaxID=3069105 RepID=UPI002E77CFF5|nr:bifunctional helix-turn-helix transcriptional regulator/GNAT family N-acetyltransferase [Dyella sp. A6]
MYLASLGKLALASRLKALSDQLYGAVDQVYQLSDAGIESRWLPVLHYLWGAGPHSVTQVAVAIGQAHSAVSQLADKLVRAGMVRRQRDPLDGRRSVLELTDQAHRVLSGLGPTWLAVQRGLDDALGSSHVNSLLDAVSVCERAMAERPLADAVLAARAALLAEPLQIVPYAAQWREHFSRLNVQWLQRHFMVEDIDRKVLGDPEHYILQPGGAIFFARLGTEIIGTCALLHESPGVFELTKMGVDEGFRGLGAGRRLLDEAIAEFHRRGGVRLFLESNSMLRTALHMYEAAGFRMQSAPRPGSHYARADVYMIYEPAGSVAGEPGPAAGRDTRS